MNPKRYVKLTALRIYRKGFFIALACMLQVFAAVVPLCGSALASEKTVQFGFKTFDLDTGADFMAYYTTEKLDYRLLNWIAGNSAEDTGMPLSFAIEPEASDRVFRRMGGARSVEGVIERVIVKEGLVIYDGAVAQIALNLSESHELRKKAERPIDTYWEGSLNQTASIRAGYPVNNFVYDSNDPYAVSSDLSDKGKRGFIFRIINAHGKYSTADPLDGKEELEGFPNSPYIHWEDWKPVAGENAWVAMAALHVYHRKYFDAEKGGYTHPEFSKELALAEELARAAILLTAENGGIRMAPRGTYRNKRDFVRPDQKQGEWWYEQVSSENNLSWYGAFRMLREITGKECYEAAMRNIEDYFKSVWNQELNYFYQGTAYVDGKWESNDEHFALDVQTWGILTFGPERIDGWFGEGSAYRMWEVSRLLSGFWSVNNELAGVGYTQEHDRLSVEWTAGAIMATQIVARHYLADGNYKFAAQAGEDAVLMRKNIDMLRRDISDEHSAYSYSSRRGWIPFGWNSHDPEVLSVASTGWMIFVDTGFNPFWLGGLLKDGGKVRALAGK